MKNIISQFKDIPTTIIADVLDGRNVLGSEIRALDEQYKFAGRALTVNMEVGDASSVFKAVAYIKAGDIIVIDAKGDQNFAVMGDFILGIFKKHKVGAVVINGVIRDILGVKDLNVPVCCKGTTPSASNIGNQGEVNVPIHIEDTTIRPGDIIVGDADGIIVVPIESYQEILAKAPEKLSKDKKHDEILCDSPESIRKYIDTIVSTKKSNQF